MYAIEFSGEARTHVRSIVMWWRRNGPHPVSRATSCAPRTAACSSTPCGMPNAATARNSEHKSATQSVITSHWPLSRFDRILEQKSKFRYREPGLCMTVLL